MIDTKKLRELAEAYAKARMDYTDSEPDGWTSERAELFDALDRVTAERDALKGDAERLDFLDDLRKREAGTDIHIGNHYPVIYARTGIGSGISFQWQGVTLRAAIDAAIRASKGEA